MEILSHIEWMIGTLVLMIFGSYGFTWLTYTDLKKKIYELFNNHLKHIEARLRRLEEKEGIENEKIDC